MQFRRLLPSVRIDEFIQKPIPIMDLTAVIKKYIIICTKTERQRV